MNYLSDMKSICYILMIGYLLTDDKRYHQVESYETS